MTIYSTLNKDIHMNRGTNKNVNIQTIFENGGIQCESKKLYTWKKIVIYLIKECFIPNHLVSFVCGICLRLDEQEA